MLDTKRLSNVPERIVCVCPAYWGTELRVVRRESLRATPWKNGGGETREIACFPPSSQLHDFEWRISTAIVAQDGEFSIFEGIDRRLYLLEGAGLKLRLGSGRPRRLRPGDHKDFRGELSVYGSLVDGPITDLNIMVRRDKQRAHIEELSLSGSANLTLTSEMVALFIRSGTLRVTIGRSVDTVNPFDTVIFESAHASAVLMEGTAEAILIGMDSLNHLAPWDSQNAQDLRLLRRPILSQFL